MSAIETFGLAVLVVAAVATAAIMSNRISERLRVPAPGIFLIGAAIASQLHPAFENMLSIGAVESIVTVALAIILFDGGMHIGWRRFRPAAVASTWLGVVGTFATAAAVAALAHALFGFSWSTSFLLGAALSPTDPAVIFSVLGRRQVAGRAGTILEGESGANDPVGIALMISLLAAVGAGGGAAGGGGGGGDSVGTVAVQFVVQMAVGAAIGVAGGAALLRFMQRVPLPSEGLYALRTLAGALMIYGATTVAHGSGFLAVFVAGILIGDAGAPYKREIERFHSSLASLSEIIAFIVLGLTVEVGELFPSGVGVTGLVLAVLLLFVVRPVIVGALLIPIRLRKAERAFVVFAGLKGAVPILLGAFAVSAGVSDADRIYHVIFVVVAISVLVQGSLVPHVARVLKIPMRTVEPEPWALGVRLRDEPHGARRYVVAADSPADGQTIADLGLLGRDTWVSLIIREGHLIQVHDDTALQAGDEVLLLAEPERGHDAGDTDDEGPPIDLPVLFGEQRGRRH